jgi:hypothetical protein
LFGAIGRCARCEARWRAWLRDYLADGQEASRDIIFEAAEGEGFKKKMIYAAKDSLGIKPRSSGFRGGWMWKLP